MHELSVAMGIVDRALGAAEDHGAETIERLTVALGAATHVNPDQLRFCIETATDGTPAAGATVEIDQITPLARCECGWEGDPGTLATAMVYAPDVQCPDCGDRTELVRGRECRLAAIELPEEAPQTERSPPDCNTVSTDDVGHDQRSQTPYD